MVPELEMEQLYDCVMTDEVILKVMDKIEMPQYNKTQHGAWHVHDNWNAFFFM